MEELSIDERIVLKWIFKREAERAWIEFIRLGIRKTGGLF